MQGARFSQKMLLFPLRSSLVVLRYCSLDLEGRKVYPLILTHHILQLHSFTIYLKSPQVFPLIQPEQRRAETSQNFPRELPIPFCYNLPSLRWHTQICVSLPRTRSPIPQSQYEGIHQQLFINSRVCTQLLKDDITLCIVGSETTANDQLSPWLKSSHRLDEFY